MTDYLRPEQASPAGSSRFFDDGAKIGRLTRACYDKLLDHERDGALPSNGRFLFYELEQDGLVLKAYPAKPNGSEHRRKPP